MTVWMGVDPGLREVAIATVVFDGTGPWLRSAIMLRTEKAVRPVEDMVRRITTDLDPETLVGVVVESQQHYTTAGRGNAHANPAELIKLATIGGAVLATASRSSPTTRLINPLPSEWKKQVDKPAHHRRIAARMGWKYRDVPSGIAPVLHEDVFTLNVRDGDWFHLLDAVGMALWGHDHGAEFLASAGRRQALRSDARAAMRRETRGGQ